MLFSDHMPGVLPDLRFYQGPVGEPGVKTETGMAVGIAKPVELSQLAQLPSPITRASKFWQFATIRKPGAYEPTLTGAKGYVEQTGAQMDNLQVMSGTNKFRLSTFRTMPAPWDEGIYA